MALKFGAFIAPSADPREDPTASYWRLMDLVEWLDVIGIDEAWIGEHHSGGWSPLSSPEVFIAAAAERTRNIMLGTGVVSLPYHHPLHVAERLVQLDHQTRGRVMLGMGAGVAPSDAYMMGINPAETRRRMAEGVETVTALLAGDKPVSMKTDWFELRDASLQLQPFTRPCFDMAVASASERGMRLAGQYGLSALTFGGRPGMNDAPLKPLWKAAEDEAAKHGQTVSRDKWRISVCMHVAETRGKALDQVRDGMTCWVRDCVRGTYGGKPNLPDGREAETAMAEGTAIIGSVDDAIEAITGIEEESGGFGTLLVTIHDWASREDTKRSFELIARFVAPAFRGSSDSLQASQRWVAENRAAFALGGPGRS
ncbi:MAG: LLM class flavin-dependent oxidoreductase [Actinobacteria bacterium]|nr:LLM class flavin-dependent oxidoreductase [Actinomycetota bacterium]